MNTPVLIGFWLSLVHPSAPMEGHEKMEERTWMKLTVPSNQTTRDAPRLTLELTQLWLQGVKKIKLSSFMTHLIGGTWQA